MQITGWSLESIISFIYNLLFQYKDEFFIAFVLGFVGRRLYRAVYGGKYTTKGLIFSPLSYLAFTAVTFIGLSIIGLMICSVSFAFGLALSNVLKGQLHFFEKDGNLYYRRSVAIAFAWTTAFTGRIYLLLYYDVIVGLLLSIILSYLTGLIIGEAFQIALQKRMFDYHHTEAIRRDEETKKLRG